MQFICNLYSFKHNLYYSFSRFCAGFMPLCNFNAILCSNNANNAILSYFYAFYLVFSTFCADSKFMQIVEMYLCSFFYVDV